MIKIEHFTFFSSTSGWHPGNSPRRSSMCTTGNQCLNVFGSPVYGMGLPKMMFFDLGPTEQSSYSVNSKYWLSSSSFSGLFGSFKCPEIVTISSEYGFCTGRWPGFVRIEVPLGLTGDLLEGRKWRLNSCVGTWSEKCTWCWDCVDEVVWVMFPGSEDSTGDIFDSSPSSKGKSNSVNLNNILSWKRHD